MLQSVPAVTVIIPLYNKERDVAQTLTTALAQTFENIEIIVINDGSTDNSEHVVRTFSDPRLRIINQVNGGECAARNTGIREARGDLIAFLDADDHWKPDHIETLIRLAAIFPQCGAFTTAYDIINPSGVIVHPRYRGIPAAPWEGIIANYFRSSIKSYLVWTSAAAIRKAVFQDVGLFKVGVNRGEDLDMWGRIALKYPIAFSTHVTAVYNKRATNRVCLNVAVPDGENALDVTLKNALLTGNYRNEVSESDIVEHLQWRSLNRIIRRIVIGEKDGCWQELRQIHWSRRLWKILVKGYCYWFVPHQVTVLWLTRHTLIDGLKGIVPALAEMHRKRVEVKPDVAFPISIERFQTVEPAN